MSNLTKLFSPGKIGKLDLKNRIIQAPMGTFSYDAEGVPSAQTIRYFEERAKGGVALIICHSVRVSAESRVLGLPNLYDDKQIPIMAKIAEAIHAAGAKCALQMNHSGKAMTYTNVKDGPPVESYALGPSPIAYVKTGVAPREASKEQILKWVEQFSDTARRVMQAGFDMVEIHAAHGYLLSSFLSPFTNRRTDEYGGSPQNRARFLCRMLERIRDKAGPDFPVCLRFNGADMLPGGATIEDALIQAPLFEKAGASMLHVSAGAHENTEVQFLSYLYPDGFLTELAASVKKVVNIPVCTVGKLGDPVVANQALEQGKADFIAMARPLLADPHLPNKAKEGRLDEINRCISCNNCTDRLFSITREAKRLFCTVNPSLFREREHTIKAAANPKKVLVIGGGIAGMQAAKVAAQRGHAVTLYEAGDKLGGAWNIASAQPKKGGYANLTRLLEKGLKEAGVKVVLNRKADTAAVKADAPDAVIVATGAVPLTPKLPGADGPNVVQAVDIITGQAKAGNRVVVIGGRMVGMETAIYLAGRGKQVSLITLGRLGENGKPLEENIYRALRDEMIKLGIQIFAGTPAYEIKPDGVFANDGGNLLWLPADTVVLAVGYKAENRLAQELKGIVPEIHTAGDCNKPRDGLVANQEGMEAGLEV